MYFFWMVLGFLDISVCFWGHRTWISRQPWHGWEVEVSKANCKLVNVRKSCWFHLIFVNLVDICSMLLTVFADLKTEDNTQLLKMFWRCCFSWQVHRFSCSYHRYYIDLSIEPWLWPFRSWYQTLQRESASAGVPSWGFFSWNHG